MNACVFWSEEDDSLFLSFSFKEYTVNYDDTVILSTYQGNTGGGGDGGSLSLCMGERDNGIIALMMI